MGKVMNRPQLVRLSRLLSVSRWKVGDLQVYVVQVLGILRSMRSCPYNKYYLHYGVDIIVLKTAAFCLTGANTISLLMHFVEARKVCSPRIALFPLIAISVTLVLRKATP